VASTLQDRSSLLYEKITMNIGDLAFIQPNITITITITSGAEGTVHL
jgi:hypothetical protein